MSTLTRRMPLKAKTRLRAKRRVKVWERGVAFIVLDGGRERTTQSAEGKLEYKARLYEMEYRQKGMCAMCGKAFTEADPATFDHQRGRTAASCDERIEVDGKWQNAALHGRCNRLKGSTKFEWVGGEYVMVMKGEKR